jgi:hypothetical protein
MNEKLTKAEFKALVDAYLGAREHQDWAKFNGTTREWEAAKIASQAAREALEKAVFG